jgi:hypothetical protein
MTLEAEVAYLHIIDGMRQNEVPAGFSAHPAPRRAARGRDRDLLLVSFNLTPGAPKDLLELLVSTYFGTPGSVTAAARTTMAAANARLHDYNRYPPVSGPVQGSLCCLVLRGTDLYVALSGGGQVLVIHPNAVEHFPDVGSEPQPPFGIEPSVEVQYFHTVVAAHDLAIVGPAIPSGIEASPLVNLASSGLESAIARLSRMAGSEASNMIVRFVAESHAPAKSKPSLTSPAAQPLATAHTDTVAATATQPEAYEAAPDVPVYAPPAGQPPRAGRSLAGIIARVRAATSPGDPTGTETVYPPIPTGADPQAELPEESPYEIAPAPVAEPASPPAEVHIGDHVYEFEEDAPADEDDEPDEPQTPIAQRMRGALRSVITRLPFVQAGQAMKQGSETIGETLSQSSTVALRRVLPEGTIRPDAALRIPDRMLMMIAIVLPIIIAVLVGLVYIQRGRNQQYQLYLDQARVEAAIARTKASPLEAKPNWSTAIQYLNQADRLFPDQPESLALRREAQAAVDLVDNVQRLALQPLLPAGFASNAQITNIVVNGIEVYALDAVRQAVYRAIVEDDKYIIDHNFQCQLGIVGTVTIKRIVDIVWLNTPNIVGQPALMALDDDGDLMYCKPDGTPPEASSLFPPDTGWKAPKAAEIYADKLYVFDPGANDILTYERVGGVFSERPKSYFTGQVLDLSTAVHFTIAQGEIYMLRNDGRMTYCVRDLATLLTNCIENALYSDSRPGHTSSDRLDDANTPATLFYDPPPEPSIYLLDSVSGSIYQLSLKLVLQRVFRGQNPMPGPVTDLAIGTNKDVFVASGNNVFWSGR